MLNTLAQELNEILKTSVIGSLLSDMGKRMYFPKGIIAQSGEAKKKGHRANATIGITVNDGHPLVLTSIKKELPNLTPEQSVAYAPTAGNPELRKIWKEKIIKKNPNLQNKNISLPVVVPGLTAGISYLADLFLSEGDVLLGGDPSWDNYALVVEARKNAQFKQFSMFYGDGYKGGFNLDALKKAIEAEEPKGVVKIILNFPQNPSGYSPTVDEAKEICNLLLQFAEKGLKIMVWCDDAYFGLDYEENIEKQSLFAYLSDLHENILAAKIDGPTKEDYVWGFRCGFLTFGSKNTTEAQYEALVKKLMGVIRSSVSCSSTPPQSIILKTFQDPNLEEEKAKYRTILEGRYRKARNFVESKKGHKILIPMPFNSGYFMSFTCVGINAEELRVKLLDERGIGTIAIDASHLRIAFSSLDKRDVDDVYQAVYEVAEELARG